MSELRTWHDIGMFPGQDHDPDSGIADRSFLGIARVTRANPNDLDLDPEETDDTLGDWGGFLLVLARDGERLEAIILLERPPRRAAPVRPAHRQPALVDGRAADAAYAR